MKYLLIIAHGSRRAASNDEVKLLAEKVSASMSSDDIVKVAFLELGLPSIPEEINKFIDSNVNELLVLPYFLSAGVHVAKDVPEIIGAAMAQSPGKNFKILPHIGAMDAMVEVVASAADCG